VVFASRSAVRERVPWPNPRLAMFDTCKRMSSIEVVTLVSRGPGRPSTSHLIFGFRVARARFFLVLSARHPVDSFISAPLYMKPTSPTWEKVQWIEGIREKCQNHCIHRSARHPRTEQAGAYEPAQPPKDQSRWDNAMESGARGVLLTRMLDTITWARARVKRGM
jgi:hypothetical protein